MSRRKAMRAVLGLAPACSCDRPAPVHDDDLGVRCLRCARSLDRKEMNTVSRNDVQAAIDAQRGAVALALAALRDDTEGFKAVVRGAPDQAALVWQTARLATVIGRGAARRHGYELDAEAALEGVLATLPATAEQIDATNPNEEDRPPWSTTHR